MTLTLEKLITSYFHLNLEKFMALYSHANLQKTLMANFIHNFIYQKFIQNTSFSFATFSLRKVKAFY